MARAVLILASRQRPHELLLLSAGVLLGAGFLLKSPPPDSVAALMPSTIVRVWAGALLVSGATGLVGCLWPGHPERGLLVELGSMLIGAAGLLIYAATAVAVAGARGSVAAGLMFCWMLANLWRAVLIQSELRRIRQGDQP